MVMRILSVFALAIMIGCADSAPSAPEGGSTTASTAGEGKVVAVAPASYQAGQSVTLHVPNMHCPFACYPKVKETLEKQDGIEAESITLVEQKDEASIDDPRIIVKLSGNFDSDKAIKAIEEVGFANAQVVSVE